MSDKSRRELFEERPDLVPVFQRNGLPRHEGVSKPDETKTDRPVDDAEAGPISTRQTLTEIGRDHTFFAHHLLFVKGFWPVDPVEEHIIETDGDCSPFQIQLPEPVFSGCEARDPRGNFLTSHWNSTVVAVPTSQWPPLFAFLCQVAGVQRERRLLYQLRPRVVRIVDVAAMRRNPAMSQLLYVPCVCFDLLGNKRNVCFDESARAQPWDPVPVRTSPPFPGLVAMGKQLFAGHASPMAGTVEPTAEAASKALRSADSSLLGKASSPSDAGPREREIIKEMTEAEKLLRRTGLL